MQGLQAQILLNKPNNFTQVENQSKNAQKVLNTSNISFPLSTSGIKIVDSNGKKVRLVGVNWSGGHLIRQCPSGLDKQKLSALVYKMKNDLQINCVRLCYSVQMIFDSNNLKPNYISENPELLGLTPFQVLNRVIEALTNEGIMVILNCHTSKSQWCCNNWDGDGLWYNNDFPEEMFFESALRLALRHKDNPRVIGIDLRNQIRNSNNVSPTWGTGDKSTDWKIAAQECAERVLQVCSHWLIFVGGLNYQLDLTPVFNHPIQLSVPNKLVYTGHLYEWSWNNELNAIGLQNDMQDLSYEKFQQIFYQTQTFVRALGVPYLLGEFGHHSPVKYWQLLERYIGQKDLDFTYWCLDGYKCQNAQKGDEEEHYGLFNVNFDGFRHEFKQIFCQNCASGKN